MRSGENAGEVEDHEAVEGDRSSSCFLIVRGTGRAASVAGPAGQGGAWPETRKVSRRLHRPRRGLRAQSGLVFVSSGRYGASRDEGRRSRGARARPRRLAPACEPHRARGAAGDSRSISRPRGSTSRATAWSRSVRCRCTDRESAASHKSTRTSIRGSQSPPSPPASTVSPTRTSPGPRASRTWSSRSSRRSGGRVVIGQHIRFDLAVLRHEAARAGVPWPDPPALDVAHLCGALERGLVDLGLESLADRFGVRIERRHTALGDALGRGRDLRRADPAPARGGRANARRGRGARRAPAPTSCSERWRQAGTRRPETPVGDRRSPRSPVSTASCIATGSTRVMAAPPRSNPARRNDSRGRPP